MELQPVRRVKATIGEWRERGTPYEVSRLVTAPVRHGLVRLTVEHREHLPASGPAILVANHVSFFDSVLMMFGLPRPVALLGKAEYTDKAVTRWLFCGAGMIPIRREDPADAARACDELLEVLRRGGVVGIYPEGTRSRDGQLHRGHTGAAHLSLLSGAPIIPVGVKGTDQILPTGARLVRPFRRATIEFGLPIVPAVWGERASTNRRRRQLTDEAMSAVLRLSGQHYVDEYAAISGAASAAVARG
ncbi:MAG: lysophospholipid acyltransferase family protein [Ilumatobacteraceae bacterium]